MKIPYIAITLLLIGAVHISSVYYDPVEHQRGGEFILLENTAAHSINLTGWRIATTVSQQDATLQGIIPARGTYLLGDEGFSELKDNTSWPEADFEHRITLANANGFVQLYTAEDELIDTVGWGGIDTYLTSPHQGVPKGYALTRIGFSDDNSIDYEQQKPFTNTNTPIEPILFTVSVNNTPPQLLSYTINNQTNPVSMHVSEEEVFVSVEIHDDNTVQNVTVRVNGYLLETNQTGVSANYTGNVPIDTSTHELHIEYSDAEYSDSFFIPVEHAEQVRIQLPEEIRIVSAPGGNDHILVPVRNAGTVPVNLHVQATTPRWAEHFVGDLRYSLAGQNYTLGSEVRIHETALLPGEEIQLRVEVLTGFVPASEYVGELFIAAVKIS
ncbi:MAG: lamin tail domain-containing protein [Candidatus Woesearchaeota archaeon]